MTNTHHVILLRRERSRNRGEADWMLTDVQLRVADTGGARGRLNNNNNVEIGTMYATYLWEPSYHENYRSVYLKVPMPDMFHK